MQLEKVTLETADEVTKPILQGAKDQMGMIPNMFALMANNPAQLDAYTKTDATFRQNSGLSPKEQEVVLLSVAVENQCTYCVAAHSFIGKNQSGLNDDELNALRNKGKLNDDRLEALHQFTIKMVQKRGFADESDRQELFDAGYDEKTIVGVVTGIGLKTLSNYFNHQAETPVDEAFAAFEWEPEKV